MDSYRNLFQDYLQGGLQQTLERVRQAEPLVPEEEREEAWHLLSYAFETDAAWPSLRALLLALAPKMEQAGFRQDWIAYLEQGVQNAQAQGDTAAVAECQLHLGILYRLLSRFDLARQWLTASEAQYAALHDRANQARARNQLAYVAYLQRRYEESEVFCQQALELVPPDDPEWAMSYFVLGMIEIDHRRWAEAEAYHTQSLQARERQGDPRKIAWSLQNLGEALGGQRKVSAAIDAFERALTILTTLGDAFNCANVQMNLGVLYDQHGQPAKAVTYYAQAETFYRQSGAALQLAKLYTNQGLAYWALGQLSVAANAFQLSIDHFAKLGDVYSRLNAVDGLAVVYLQQGEAARAKPILERALQELAALDNADRYQLLRDELSEHLAQANVALASTSPA